MARIYDFKTGQLLADLPYELSYRVGQGYRPSSGNIGILARSAAMAQDIADHIAQVLGTMKEEKTDQETDIA